jgi:hypothetical protein
VGFITDVRRRSSFKYTHSLIYVLVTFLKKKVKLKKT